jgi:glutamate-1-semialdehyde 2,1-aminomutase
VTGQADGMERSRALYEEACRLMPAGVNSPVRAFLSVGGTPRYFRRASGARFEDEDGNRFVDFCCSWGALILGHAPPAVVRAVSEAAAEGLSFGAPSRREIALARRIVGRIPAIEMVRFVSSGTEAVMSAVRLARGFTGRDIVVKFDGCYHGHSDALLVKGGSGLVTFGTASSAGVPEGAVRDTVVIPLDDEAAVDALFREKGDRIACVIIEGVPANAGLLIQRREFVHHLRKRTTEAGALLILDEVISGFRVGRTGAAGHYGVTPDLVTYGKIIGGGMPVGAFGGRREIMERLAPLGPVYQAGTLSGNPVAMAAGDATLVALDAPPDAWARLDAEGRRLEEGILTEAARIGRPLTIARIGGVFWLAFQEPPAPLAFHQIHAEGMDRYRRLHAALLARGIYFAPSGWEVGFLTLAHIGEPVDRLLEAIGPALAEAWG